MTRIWLVGLLMLGSTLPASAADMVRQKKTYGRSWTLNYNETSDLGKFCSLDGGSGEGHIFSVAAYSTRQLVLIAFNKKWKLPERRSLPITATFDNAASRTAEFERARQDVLSLAASEKPDFFFEFLRLTQNAKTVAFKLSTGEEFRLDLTGASEALKNWELCARDWAGYVVNIAEGVAPQPQAKGKTYTGTGIVLSTDGHIVTNAHVVEKCEKIMVRHGEKMIDAALLHADATNDLALLQTKMTFQKTAQIAEQPAELGAKVAVFGFPLTGSLSSGGNFTLGSVSGLTGFRDDKRVLQITAPIQAGNSGGPVVDRKGRLVGVVRATLGTSKPGENIQNVNFAIRASILKEFLDARKAPYTLASGPPGRDRPDTDLAAGAKAIATLVICQQKG